MTAPIRLGRVSLPGPGPAFERGSDMEGLDNLVLQIIKGRSRWGKKTCVRLSELECAYYSRHGTYPRDGQIEASLERLQRRGLLRWLQMKGNDITFLV